MLKDEGKKFDQEGRYGQAMRSKITKEGEHGQVRVKWQTCKEER